MGSSAGQGVNEIFALRQRAGSDDSGTNSTPRAGVFGQDSSSGSDGTPRYSRRNFVVGSIHRKEYAELNEIEHSDTGLPHYAFLWIWIALALFAVFVTSCYHLFGFMIAGAFVVGAMVATCDKRFNEVV